MSALLVLALLVLLPQSPAAEPHAPPARVGGAIQAPRKIRNVVPDYPADARRAGLGGRVVLECTVSPRGEVVEAIVRQGVPPLTDAARKAVMRWRYTPTLLDGVAVPVIMTVTVNFEGEKADLRDVIGSLRHRNEHIRAAAAQNLGTLRVGGFISGADVRDAIQALEPLVEKDQSPRVRAAVARALSRLDGRPLAAGPAPTSPPSSMPPGPPASGAATWGRLVDPLGQCDVTEGHDRIEVQVPPGAYDLSIELGQVTAPRVTQPVEGDVVAQVTVGELPDPGQGAADQPRLPYHGAGLLLWQDERNYVRLESAVYREARSAVRYALFEIRRDGRLIDGLSRPDVRLRHAPADLRLERRGRDLRALVRQGDEAWREAGRAQVDLAGTLEVGIAVVNTARTPLRGAFSGYELLGKPGTVQVSDRPDAPPPAPGDGRSPSFDYDSPPRPLSQSRPQYPQEAFVKKIEGTVLVEILIDSEGRVARTRVLQSVPGLDEAALDCIRRWEFTPARKDGRSVPTIAHVPITFRIGE